VLALLGILIGLGLLIWFAFRSAQITEDKCHQIGLARCPFEITNFEVKDGRKANITNSGFGTVFGVVDGKSLPVCDHAGFAAAGPGGVDALALIHNQVMATQLGVPATPNRTIGPAGHPPVIMLYRHLSFASRGGVLSSEHIEGRPTAIRDRTWCYHRFALNILVATPG
jgi:hypothetical protein